MFCSGFWIDDCAFDGSYTSNAIMIPTVGKVDRLVVTNSVFKFHRIDAFNVLSISPVALEISGCTFRTPNAHGVACVNMASSAQSTLTFTHNLVVDNGSGIDMGGVELKNALATIANNKFVDIENPVVLFWESTKNNDAVIYNNVFVGCNDAISLSTGNGTIVYEGYNVTTGTESWFGDDSTESASESAMKYESDLSVKFNRLSSLIGAGKPVFGFGSDVGPYQFPSGGLFRGGNP